jgi:very-short-patch-repair endonuclease
MQCKLCDVKFISNHRSYLQAHLQSVHQLDEFQYVVMTEYDGLTPRCDCGLCNEIPVFDRGKFKQYALRHNSFEVRKNLYIQQFGQPCCQNLGCENAVKFFRGKPNKFCSPHCSGKNTGFSLEKTQKAVSNTVRERYGVDNVFQIEEVKEKNKQYFIENPRDPWFHTDETKHSISIKSTKRWENPEYKERTSKAISNSLQTSEHHEQRSKKMKLQNEDPIFQVKAWAGCKTRLSKPHQLIRKELNLEALGFVSEQRIDCYFVDELLVDKKIIIEINGDYPHANPFLFEPTYVIKLRGQRYTAQEKWEMDQFRKEKLEKLGYKVLVIWESDNLEVWREIVKNTIYTAST